MGLQLVEPPILTRKSKYDYEPGEVTEAAEALRKGGAAQASDGPFETQGQARSAGNRLCVLIREQDPELNPGVRTWEAGEGADAGHYFALKPSRKLPNGSGAQESSGKKGGKGGKK